MKVLHISHTGMPDARVEKMGMMGKKLGHDIHFAGPVVNDFRLGGRTFTSYSRYKMRKGVFGFLSPNVRRNIKKIIEIKDPDVVHVHDIFGAVSVEGIDVPVVFDDHEFFSEKRSSFSGWKDGSTYHRLFGWVEARWWRWLEQKFTERACVITVSNPIAEYYRKLGVKSFVIPNYPSAFELEKATFSANKYDKFSAVYLGRDMYKIYAPYRDSGGALEMLNGMDLSFVVVGDNNLVSSNNVKSTGFIPHIDIYGELSKCHVGIVPWKPHPYHRVCSLNKAYIYAHSGLVVILNSSFENLIEEFNETCIVVDDLEELEWALDEMIETREGVIDMGLKTAQFAQNNFIFENYENVLEKAYEEATRNGC